MKYSNVIGIAASLALIVVCFVPWVFIPSINSVITGMRADHTNYGSPGLMNLILSVVATILFGVSAVWAKRANVFIATFNLAWSIRNFILVTQCDLGECPQKRAGIYLLLVLSFLIIIMALLPKLDVRDKNI